MAVCGVAALASALLPVASGQTLYVEAGGPGRQTSPDTRLLIAAGGGGARADAATARCALRGRVLARRRGVVIWQTLLGGIEPVYLCAPPRARADLLFAGRASGPARVTRLKLAGRFIAFFLQTQVTPVQTQLIVFDAARGRIELRDLVGCQGEAECARLPALVGYLLAPDGWVAEVYDGVNNAYPNEPRDTLALVATDDAKYHWPLDTALG